MKELLQFFLLAFAISWGFWIPSWLAAIGVQAVPVIPYHAELSGLGPLLAAVSLAASKRGVSGVLGLLVPVVSRGRGPY